MNNKKIIIVILALVIVIAALAGVGIAFKDEISDALSGGGRNAAVDDADDIKRMDVVQEGNILLRLGEIKNAITDKTMTRDQALEELSSMAELNIPALEEDISAVVAWVGEMQEDVVAPATEENEATDATQKPDDDSELTDAEPTSAAVQTTQAENTTEQALQNEPLPDVSMNPRIVTADTVVGTVLSSSNVNAARSFGAEKAIDGYYDSCWCVSTGNRGGAGGSICFELAEKSVVSGVRLVNGNLYLPDEDIFRSNGQVAQFTLKFSDGTTLTYIADYNDDASSDYQYFDFDVPVTTEWITLTVDSGYAGVKYTENVCLGEFDVY